MLVFRLFGYSKCDKFATLIQTRKNILLINKEKILFYHSRTYLYIESFKRIVSYG